MQSRRRVKQAVSFKDRIAAFADRLRRTANELAPGPERDELEKKLHRAEIAAHIDEWANSPELQPPKQANRA